MIGQAIGGARSEKCRMGSVCTFSGKVKTITGKDTGYTVGLNSGSATKLRSSKSQIKQLSASFVIAGPSVWHSEQQSCSFSCMCNALLAIG